MSKVGIWILSGRSFDNAPYWNNNALTIGITADRFQKESALLTPQSLL